MSLEEIVNVAARRTARSSTRFYSAQAMREYVRTEWYGLSYMLHAKGMLLPRLIPCAVGAALISGVVSSEAVDDLAWCQDDGSPLFEHPFYQHGQMAVLVRP